MAERPPARSRATRRADTLHRLATDVDAWVASAGDGFDPRTRPTPYLYFRVRPRRIQAWREADEQAGRDLMRDGRWLADTEPDGASRAGTS